MSPDATRPAAITRRARGCSTLHLTAGGVAAPSSVGILRSAASNLRWAFFGASHILDEGGNIKNMGWELAQFMPGKADASFSFAASRILAHGTIAVLTRQRSTTAARRSRRRRTENRKVRLHRERTCITHT